MQPRMQLDVSKLVQAVRAYGLATKKDGAEILNRTARNLAYRSASFTPIASASKIRRDLMRDPHLRYALTSIALRKRGIGVLKKPEFAKAVESFVSQRAASARYLRAGWAKAIQQLGGSFRGVKPFRGASGFANKATAARLVTEIVNIVSQPDAAHAAGAEAVGLQALQEAIKFVAADMQAYARDIMARTAAAHSG